MKTKQLILGFGVLFAMGCTKAQAAEDLNFLKELGGTVVNQSAGATTVSFKDGTMVTLTGTSMMTTSVSGDVFISDAASGVYAVNVPGRGLVQYPNAGFESDIVTDAR